MLHLVVGAAALAFSSTAMAVVETFDGFAGGTTLSSVGGGGVWWTQGGHAVVAGGGVAGSNGIGSETSDSYILNWQGKPFQWSALASNDTVAIGLDLQSSSTGKFDDDRAGWTIDAASNTSSTYQFAIQLDNTTDGGMVCYWDTNRTVLNPLSGIKNSTWYRLRVAYTKLTDTSAAITATLTELDASGNPTGTPYVGTIADSSAAPYSVPANRFTSTYQWPTFKNYRGADGNADNASFAIEPGKADYVIVISVDGMGSAYVTPLLASGLANELVNIKRFMNEGTGTLNARDDYNYAITLPNHVTMMTSRGVTGTAGHGWTSNTDPGAATLESNKGSYVDSGFGVAHDAGLRTGIWSGKSKFSLFQQSYSATTGAADTNGVDNGRDKIDYDLISNGISAAAITTDFTNQMTAAPCHFSFLHYQDPDATGHASGWSTDPASAFATTLKAVDTAIGRVLQMIENSPTLAGRTAVILTADHGGHGTTHGDTTNPLDYTIPFYVWGPGVTAGADLYTINPTTREAPGASVNPPYTGPQPVRDGDAANMALDLLGLPPVPNSMIDAAQDLAAYGEVDAQPQPPAVAITSPANGATQTSPVTINATATDADGSVTNVQFFAGSTWLGNDTTSPYSVVWSSAPNGSYALKAVAYDNDGLCTTSTAVNITVAAASSGFTAYNDCSSSATTPANTTQYRGNGTASGYLKDFATGTVQPVTLTITANQVTYDGTGGPMPNSGTDAYNVFNGKVVFDDAIWYTTITSGWWMDATFTGLDPQKQYEFVTSVNRGGSGSDYGQRWSKFTISGADACVQAGTPGVTVLSNESVSFISGSNTVNGYVARWTNIRCGADGTFKVRVNEGGGANKGYAFDGIMLRETSAQALAPTVSITSPADEASVPLDFTIEATASDTDGTVTNVEFLADGAVLGSDATSPYAFTWSGAPAGSHELLAVAWDNDGLCTTSAAVSVTVVAPQPPTVSITSPAESASVGTSFTIQATASDLAGTVTNVEFLADGAVLGSDATSPYSFSWSGVAPGAHALTAVAWDNDGVCTTSTPVNVTVAYQPPTVSISSPAQDATVGTAFTISATASDSDGTVTNVEFLADGAVLGSDATSPYSFSWSGVAPGAHALTAVAWDNDGVCTTSATVNVTAAYQPPTVSISSPAQGATVGTSFTISANASDTDGTVTNVAFYLDNALRGNDASSPFSQAVTGVAVGSHTLKAVAWDSTGLCTTSATINVTATGQKPSVSISSPTNGATVRLGFEIKAAASDTDGTVASVAFYGDGALLGTDTSSPYSQLWAAPAAGSRQLFAVALDSDGYIATSAVITVTASPSVGFEAYNDCSSSASTPANTTQWRTDSTNTGLLKDFASGGTLPVTLALAAANVSYNVSGGFSAAGTDCYAVFNGKVTFDDSIAYQTGVGAWWMTATFTGLDPAKEYEFVTSGNRNTSTYTGRFTKFTISGVDACLQASTPGVDVVSNETVRFCTGYNTVNGYVARWKRIRCGADGTFVVRAEDGAGADPAKSYGFDGIMLRETAVPEPVVVGSIAIDGASISLSWSGAPGKARVEQTDSLSEPAWTTVPGATNLQGGAHSFEMDGGVPRRFYRVVGE